MVDNSIINNRTIVLKRYKKGFRKSVAHLLFLFIICCDMRKRAFSYDIK